MTVEEFRASLGASTPPRLGAALEGLWWDAKGDWDQAHRCAQAQDDAEGAAVHAYLHRKEGDLANADYWYRRAGARRPDESLGQEWESLVETLLKKEGGRSPL